LRFTWFSRFEEGVIAFLLALMTLITFMQVVARYIFNYSFVWALELVMYLFGAMIFLGIAYGVRVGAHIGIDAVTRMLSPPKARAVAIVATTLCMIYAAIIFVGAWAYVGKIHEIGIMAQDIPIPAWVPRIVLPIGFALLFVRFGQVLYRLATGKEGHLLGDEAEEALRHRTDSVNAPEERP
jgi:C4-dicarboxylate transporter DctQ subunit